MAKHAKIKSIDAEFLSGKARAIGGVAHQLPRRGLRHEEVFHAEVAHHLDGSLVGDVRTRCVGQLPVLGDDRDTHAVGGERKSHGATRRARTHHQDVGVGIPALLVLLVYGLACYDRWERRHPH